MLKQRARTLAVSIFLLDLALVALAFVVAYWLRSSLLPWLAPGQFPLPLYPLANYLPLLPLALGIWGVLLLQSRQYRSHRTVLLPEEAWSILRTGLLASVIFTLTIYAFRLDQVVLESDLISRLWILLFSVLACTLLLTEKLAIRVLSRYVRARGFNYRTVLVVGTGKSAAEVIQSVQRHVYWGFRVLGLVTTADSVDPRRPAVEGGIPLLGTLDDIPKILETNVVDDVVFAVTRRELDRMEDLFLMFQELGIRTQFALNLFPHTQSRVELEELDGIPMLTFSTGPSSLLQLLAKRMLDVAIAGILLLLGMPVVLGIALAIKATSGGRVLFAQTRCGLNGRRFTLYKFRTMVEGAENRRAELEHLNEMDGPVFKLRRDPRVTWLGRFLRKFSLDELPQLWNVLRGDMSLVGPRPPIPEEVAKYQRWQRRRLAMKPGLTCLWQISGRNEIDFDRWIQLDLEYIDSWSPSLDFKILLKTIPVVLSGRGAS
jgi:exopolysaccharide biosynthesis polyprenyl glycosylphosphotransferase